MARTYTVTYMCRGAVRGTQKDFTQLQQAYTFFNQLILTDRELVAIDLRLNGKLLDGWIRLED
jgi:hypothetical protein